MPHAWLWDGSEIETTCPRRPEESPEETKCPALVQNVARSQPRRRSSETLPLQRLPIDTQDLRGFTLVATGELEHPGDMPTFERFEGQRLRGLGGRSEQGPDQLGVDLVLDQRDRPFEHVLQLTDVAREVVGDQEGERFRTQGRHRNAFPAAEVLDERAHE